MTKIVPWGDEPPPEVPQETLVPDAAAAAAIAPLPLRPSPVMAREKSGLAIRWHRYRERISYSSCNEHTACEREVLLPQADKRLVAICASGGRVLSLLLDGAKEVWAVDVNPSQTHLLELKVAGMRNLEHAAFLEFMGVRPSPRRLDTYDGLRPSLSTAARAYFDSKPFLVERGVLYQGSLERFFARYVSPATRLLRPRWRQRLFACTDLAEQKRLLPSWNGLFWRTVLKTICRRRFFQLFSHEPGFWRYFPPELKLHDRIFGGVARYLDTHLARNNHLLWLVFFGRYANEQVMPEYLLPDGFARVKQALASTRLHLVNGTMDGVLAGAPAQYFDGVSLSDISSYLSQEAFGQTIEQILRTARPGGRLCSRGVFYHRDFHPEHAPRLRRNLEVEQRLERDDHAMVHTFVAAEIP